VTRRPPLAAYPRELNTLGDHLRKRRLDLGLLQRHVAEKLGANKQTICNWENNQTSPQLRFLPRIIQFIGYVPHDTRPRTLGKQIVHHRHILGLSQKQLARRLGVDPSTLSRWERNEGRPSKKLLERLDAFPGSFPARDST